MASTVDTYYKNTYGPTGTNTLVHYYSLAESSGSAQDAIGSLNSSTPGAGVTQGSTRILPFNDGETCYAWNTSTNATLAFTSAFLTAYPLTLECWVRGSTFSSGGGVFIGITDGNSGVHFGYLSALTWLGLFNTGTSFHTVATVTLNNGTSYHCVVTSDGTSANTKLYLNGVLQTNTASTNPASIASETVSGIGNYGSNFTSGVNASLEKVAIYNAILNQTQITNNFNAGNTGPPSGGPFPPSLCGNLGAGLQGGYSGC